MPDRLTQTELEAYLWSAANILRGLVDAGDYKQYIFPLLFYSAPTPGNLQATTRVAAWWRETGHDVPDAMARLGGQGGISMAVRIWWETAGTRRRNMSL